MMRLKLLLAVVLSVASLPSAENVKAIGAVAKANVKAVGAVAEANIKAVGPVDNTAGGGPSIWKQQTTDNDDWGNTSANFSQRIKNTEAGATTVTKVTVTMHAIATTQNVKVGLWSNSDGTGTQYGADSQNTSVSTGASAAYDFTWSVNPSVPAGTDFHIVVTPSLGSSEIQFQAGTVAGGTFYEDTTYAAYRATTAIASGTSDLVFTIWKQ